MNQTTNLDALRTSWTKYDAVKVIDIISSGIPELEKYLSGEKAIDPPSLKNFLGIDSYSDEIPEFWKEIQKFPEQKRLFCLIASIFTHHENIQMFANDFSSENMTGTFVMSEGKQFTNLRSALVESGAAPTSSRRDSTVDYNLTPLFEEGAVGLLMRQLLELRLRKMNWDGNSFISTCISHNFHKVLCIKPDEFKKWIEGNPLVESPLKYNLNILKAYQEFNTYKVNQWLKEWDDINFSEEEMRRKPQPFYLMFKMDARLLKRLSDVHRRKADRKRSEDSSVQRTHNESRSDEIHQYIHGGFPWSTISASKRESDEYRDLKMPGILPTAIIANILGPDSERSGKKINENDQIKIDGLNSDFPKVTIPDSVFDEDWDPELKPIEIIDGQHRLWAFDEKEDIDGSYELPVIAYYDLDLAWQAYLFYTINIKPVKINTSLGYDLYPLLRTQEWLENSKEGLIFYRENRAQELVEALWSYEGSSWKGRIKMLGEGEGNISQAAFIRALTSSFLKKSSVRNNWGMGGLFSSSVKKGEKHQIVDWNRTQQAAFLILIWNEIKKELDSKLDVDFESEEEPVWASQIRKTETHENSEEHPAFSSKNSFLSRDQGVRGISMYLNDFFFSLAMTDKWNLNELSWEGEIDDKKITSENIDIAIKQFKAHGIYLILQSIVQEIIKFDWRTPSSDFSDDPEKKIIQTQYKGGSGYNVVWKSLIELISESKDALIAEVNSSLIEWSK